MTTSRSTGFYLACAALLASACSTSVVGNYELDLDESKAAVDKAVAEHPDMAHLKADTIKMLEATRVDVALTEDGKMTTQIATTTALAGPGTQRQQGTWKLDGKRVQIHNDEVDTRCDVDGKRLRCENQTLPPLLTRYVLRRK
jgi:hypothetical protein